MICSRIGMAVFIAFWFCKLFLHIFFFHPLLLLLNNIQSWNGIVNKYFSDFAINDIRNIFHLYYGVWMDISEIPIIWLWFLSKNCNDHSFVLIINTLDCCSVARFIYLKKSNNGDYAMYFVSNKYYLIRE